MFEFFIYLYLAKEIALILLNVVVLVLAAVFMVVGLFTCLRSLKRKKVKEKYGGIVHRPPDHINCSNIINTANIPIAFWKEIKVDDITLLVYPYYLEAAKRLLKTQNLSVVNISKGGLNSLPITLRPKPPIGTKFKDASTGKEEKWIKKEIWVREDNI